MKKNPKQQLLLFFLTVPSFQSAFTLDFLFNGFNPTDLLLYGTARTESKVLTLTNQTYFAIGRALYPKKVATKWPNTSHVVPFSTSFIFSLAPYKGALPGHGIVFIFAPAAGIEGTISAQHLGLFNRTNNGDPNNHVFGVEFDVFNDQEFDDIDNNHVGVDVNSLTSTSSHTAGYWRRPGAFEELKLNNGKNYQAWIDYCDNVVNVSLAIAGTERPEKPLLSVDVKLSGVFEDEMFVGFTGATGKLVEGQRILGWSFSNSNFSVAEGLITAGLPSFVLPSKQVWKIKAVIVGVVVGSCFGVCVIVLLLFRMKRRKRRGLQGDGIEEWELDYWPHRMKYQVIDAATIGFSEENVIGIGGNGKVYKGVLPGGVEVAVKHILHVNDGSKEFLTEISSLSRLRHRNLMGLRGWCIKERGTFLLIYDYMENGSLDNRVFECDESYMLGFKERCKILKDVAEGVLYLHEGCEAEVLHRDIKASSVLLDKDMNGRLGDFGLARVHKHEQLATTIRVVGTVGYLAPEVVKTGRASTRSDVFGFGMLVLEVMCGRCPLEEGQPALVDWVWQLKMQGELLNALDVRLRSRGGYDDEEVDRMLHLGLLCAYPDPGARPSMRQVVQLLEGQNESGEKESGNLDADMLQMVKSKDSWSNYSQYSGSGSHLTFEGICLSNPSPMPSSWNVTMVEAIHWGKNAASRPQEKWVRLRQDIK